MISPRLIRAGTGFDWIVRDYGCMSQVTIEAALKLSFKLLNANADNVVAMAA